MIVPAVFAAFHCLKIAAGMLAATTPLNDQAPGRWVTTKVYSEIFGISENTLITWRYMLEHDRGDPKRTYPITKKFGRSVRYWLPPGSYDPVMFENAKPNRFKSRKKDQDGDKKPAAMAVQP